MKTKPQTFQVSKNSVSKTVYLQSVYEGGYSDRQYALSPNDARELANKLNRAADSAERNPVINR